MKILIVASYTLGNFSPFVREQVKSISELGHEFEFFGIKQKGVIGYLSCRSELITKIKEFNPDIIHAHYGLSGLLANLQRSIPVITTFHGSDIHSRGVLLGLSKIVMRLSAFNIFVSSKLKEISSYNSDKSAVIPCGIDTNIFYSIPKEDARKKLGWGMSDKYILFAGAFSNKVKCASLAHDAILKLDNYNLIELKGYSREEINTLMNGCDSLLMTSEREASPMVIKEAMQCGAPIVSVDVGDVRDMIENIDGCYLVDRSSNEIADKIVIAASFGRKTEGANVIHKKHLDISAIAKQVEEIYYSLMNNDTK